MTNVIDALLIFLIVLTPLAFGTVEIWAIASFEFLVSVTALVFLWQKNNPDISTGENIQIKKSNLVPFLIGIFLFLIIIVFQLIPLPKSVLLAVSPHTALFYDRIFSLISGWTQKSLTFNAYETQFELYKLIAYAMVFFIIVLGINSKKRINKLILAIFLTGFVISIFGIMQNYSYTGKLYWLRHISAAGEPFGPFVNRDHFGGYINLIIPLGLGYLLTNIEKSKKILVGYFTVIMITALVISLSRGAVLSFLGSLIFFTLLVLMFTEVRKGKIIFPIAGIIAVTALFLFWLDWGLVIARLHTIIDSESGIMRLRLPVWIDSLKIVKDFPIFGVGFGNFQNVFPLYQHSLLNRFWRHTHNDYLQSAIEMGPVSIALLLAFYAMLVWYVVKLLRTSADNWKIGLSIGAITSCMTILLHSFVDFNLRTTSNAFLFTVITGLVISIIRFDDEKKEIFYAGKKTKILFTSLIVLYMSFAVRIFISDRYYDKSLEAKDIKNEIYCVEKASRWNFKNPDYHHRLALLYQEKAAGKDTKPYEKYKLLFSAKNELETAITRSPAQIKYLASYGWLLGNLGRHEEAIKVFNTAVELNPDLKPAAKLKKDFLNLKGRQK